MDVQSECSGGRGQEGGISRPSLSVVLGRCVQVCSRGRVSGHVGSSYQTKQVRRAQRSPSTGHDPRAPTPDTGQSPEPCRPQPGAGGEGRKQVLVPWRRPGSERGPLAPGACSPHLLIALWAPRAGGSRTPSQPFPAPSAKAAAGRAASRPVPRSTSEAPEGPLAQGGTARLRGWTLPHAGSPGAHRPSPRLAVGVPSLPPPFRRSHMNEPWRLVRR